MNKVIELMSHRLWALVVYVQRQANRINASLTVKCEGKKPCEFCSDMKKC